MDDLPIVPLTGFSVCPSPKGEGSFLDSLSDLPPIGITVYTWQVNYRPATVRADQFFAVGGDSRRRLPGNSRKIGDRSRLLQSD